MKPLPRFSRPMSPRLEQLLLWQVSKFIKGNNLLFEIESERFKGTDSLKTLTQSFYAFISQQFASIFVSLWNFIRNPPFPSPIISCEAGEIEIFFSKPGSYRSHSTSILRTFFIDFITFIRVLKVSSKSSSLFGSYIHLKVLLGTYFHRISRQ